jgi:hypothetical protein
MAFGTRELIDLLRFGSVIVGGGLLNTVEEAFSPFSSGATFISRSRILSSRAGHPEPPSRVVFIVSGESDFADASQAWR